MLYLNGLALSLLPSEVCAKLEKIYALYASHRLLNYTHFNASSSIHVVAGLLIYTIFNTTRLNCDALPTKGA